MTNIPVTFQSLIGADIIAGINKESGVEEGALRNFVRRLDSLEANGIVQNLQTSGVANRSAYGQVYGFTDRAPKSLQNLLFKINKDLREQENFYREGMIQDIVWNETAGNRLTPRVYAFTSVVMLMERIDGNSVTRLIKQPMNKTTKVSLSEQIVTAIRRLHNLGFIHLDLHAGNLMYGKIMGTNKPDKMWIIDFGMTVHYYDMKDKGWNKRFMNSKVMQAYAVTKNYYLNGKDNGNRQKQNYYWARQLWGSPVSGELAQPIELFARINDTNRTLINDIIDPRSSTRRIKFDTGLKSKRGIAPDQEHWPANPRTMTNLRNVHKANQRKGSLKNRLPSSKSAGSIIWRCLKWW